MAEESSIMGYLAAGGGLAMGWVLSSIVQLDAKIKGFLGSVFTAAKRADTVNVAWTSWAAWLFAELIYGMVAAYGYHRFHGTDIFAGVVMGVGIGGIIETGMQIPA